MSASASSELLRQVRKSDTTEEQSLFTKDKINSDGTAEAGAA
jgi:hypothetical protein